MRLLALYGLAAVIYGLLILFNLLRGAVKKSNYDYWISAYLFDKNRSIGHRLLLLFVYITAIFVVLYLYVEYQGLEIPYLT